MKLQNMKLSEDTEQIIFMQWCRAHENEYPQLQWLHHIPNGGKRSSREAAKLKQMGVKAGVADISFPYPHGRYIGMYMELKHGHNVPTPAQRDFLRQMQAAGHYCCICYSAAGAVRVLLEYLNLLGESELTGASIEDSFGYKLHKTWELPIIR